MVDFKLLGAAKKVGADYQKLVKLKALTKSPVFGEKLAAMIAFNRKLKTPMPASRADRQHALTIMEWAYESTEAEAAAPELVAGLRAFYEKPFADDAHWRTAFDLALDVWKARDDQLRKQAF